VAVISFTVPSNAVPNTYALTFEPTIGPTTTTVITDNNFVDHAQGSGLTLSDGSLVISPVPEPASLLLTGGVAAVVAAGAWHRRKANPTEAVADDTCQR
jgi:hypothetical protein